MSDPLPRLIADPALEGLELTAAERKMVQLVRRHRTLAGLASATGLEESELRTLLDHLAHKGAFESGRSVSKPDTEDPPRSRDSSEIDPDALEPTIDLDLATQKKVLRLEAKLRSGDFYELLGISAEADKSEVKAAYFALIGEFHTDKYYKRNLGSYEARMRNIVQALTKASDTLSRKKTRAEYDAYLASRRGTLGARESVLPRSDSGTPESGRSWPGAGVTEPHSMASPSIPGPPRAPVIEGVDEPSQSSSPPLQGAIGRAPPLEDLTELAHQPTQRAPAISGTAASSAPGSGHNRLEQPKSTTRSEAARRMLARKMGGRAPGSSVVPGGPSPSGAPAQITPEQRRDAVRADLKARYAARLSDGEPSIDALLAKSQKARAAGDWSSAVAALRLALQHRPDDLDLQAQLERMQAEADQAMAPRFLEQAKYEEKQRSYERAARSYERAARGRDSAELFDKAASCILRVGQLDDSMRRKAVEMAREAVKRDNRNVDYRLTLARAYDGAGMRSSALGEARRALEIQPANQDAKNLYKAFK